MTPFVFDASQAAATPCEPGRLSAKIFAQGSMQLRWYSPQAADAQTPHFQDEIYMVVTGRGIFLRGADLFPFGPGDAIFVAAGVSHRFEEFSDDLGVWVVFYGPEGGEA